MPTGPRLAAIDLGSNSFRLEIAQLQHGQLQRTEYLKETVRQGAGLDADHNLSADAMQRGWDCLARFAERLTGFAPQHVRAVATQTLREARNRDIFLARAQRILGHPIDVIAGPEEARLIYLGVTHLLPPSDERRLVLDIGGRSTELIIGQARQTQALASYPVGSVAWTLRHFPDGVMNARHFQRAEIAAHAIFEPSQASHHRRHWDTAYGCSGTVSAIADALHAAGRSPQPGLITRDGLHWMRDKLIKARHFHAIQLTGIKEDRKPVAAGGLAVLLALFDALDIHTLHHTQGALRHGALYDLLNRSHPQHDIRHTAIDTLAARCHIDTAQSQRVSRIASHLHNQLNPPPHTPTASADTPHQTLAWAARLHEIGAHIAHSDQHKHGAYILRHTDIAGFALHQQHTLSQLVLGQRGKLRKVQEQFDNATFMHQLLALRLAIILCHARQDPDANALRLSSDRPRHIHLHASAAWLHAHPQSARLLREEAAAWHKTPWRLHLRPI